MEGLVKSVPEEGFRLQSKKFMLTYKTHLPKAELSAFVDRAMKEPCDVKICHETSDDGYMHTHCCVLTHKKPDITDSRRFDFNTIHPNVQIPKTVEHWRNMVKYVEKQDPDVYGDIEVKSSQTDLMEQTKKYVETCTTWHDVVRCPDASISLFIAGKMQFCKSYFEATSKKDYTSKYTLSQFKAEPVTDFSKAVLFTGMSKAGKTNFALAHFKKPLKVYSVDDLLKLNDSYDGLVFDDMSFTKWPVESVIQILDMSAGSVRCRYHNVDIPAGMPRIFTHNDNPFPDASGSQQEAIQRRLVIRQFTEPAY